MSKKEVKKEAKIELSKVLPIKDFKFSFQNKIYDLKKGKESEVDKRLLSNLKTEKVIK